MDSEDVKRIEIAHDRAQCWITAMIIMNFGILYRKFLRRLKMVNYCWKTMHHEAS
jgi:hypothetical protein